MTASRPNSKIDIQHDELPDLPVVTSRWIDRVIFTGTGTSSQVPAVGCVLRDPNSTSAPCITCVDAMRPGSKNRRGCTSAAIVGRSSKLADAEESLILIDCGPTFNSSALRYFPSQGLRKIDAILLTHAHADAILGLDSLRGWTMGGTIQDRVDIYCTSECYETVKGMFPYLADTSKSTGGGGVGEVKFHTFDAQKSFQVPLFSGDSVEVKPLPLHHGNVRGKPFQCLGFRIDTFSYVSDCHHIPPSTAQLMTGSEVIVLDALKPWRHPSHFSLPQALSFTLSMPSPAPKLSLLTDLTHDLEHHSTERNIQAWRREMEAWKRYLHCSNGEERRRPGQARLGEGGGPRWWAGIWDERQAEVAKPDGLERSIISRAGQQHQGTTPSNGTADYYPLPSIHLTFDGMVLHFERQA
ncbi:hypothetical protein CBS101457_005554 [Exobasidium rhododendri]|nr:hypothetical protein CBS101457_005554 [Exobasidium rhododendri]